MFTEGSVMQISALRGSNYAKIFPHSNVQRINNCKEDRMAIIPYINTIILTY